MDDKKQTVSHRKTLEEGELDGASCSPHLPATGSADSPACSPGLSTPRPADSTACTFEQAITRLPNAENCRECLGALAHRLAQPMTALRGGIELGLMGKRSVTDYRNLLEQSLQLADSMVQLIVSMRELGESTARAGRPQSVALRPAVEEALAEMECLAQAQNLRLQLDAEGTAEICADPMRLRDSLQSLLAWVIQNSAGGETITINLSVVEGTAQMVLTLPRLDLQYLQIKMLDDITTPGLLFSHAAKSGALGWAINQRLLEGLGGKLEMLTEDSGTGCIRLNFPMAPAG